MTDQIQSLDLRLLLLTQSGLSLVASLGVAPVYSLPLALYGLFVTQGGGGGGDDGGDSVRAFAALFGASFVLDFGWLMSSWRAETTNLGLLLILFNWVLKPVTILSALGRLREQGQPTFSLPSSFSLPGSFPPSNNHNNQRETVWSAPSGRGGYQGFQDEEEAAPTPRAPAGPAPPIAQQHQAAPTAAPKAGGGGGEGGGYHSLE